MNRLSIIRPDDDIMEKIYSLLYRDLQGDYSENLVVFPNRRPGHYLRKLIAEKEERTFLPPVIYSINDFIDGLFKRLFDYRECEKIEALSILYRLSLSGNRLAPEFRSLDRFYPFGMRLFEALEELYIEGITPEKLRDLETLIEIPEKSKYDLRFLSELYSEFYEELVKKSLSTRAFRYRRVSEREDLYSYLNSYKTIIFAGFYAFTESEKRLMKRLIADSSHSSGRVYFIFYEGEGIGETIKALFQSSILEDNSGIEDSGFSQKPFKIYSAPDIHGEVKKAGNLLKKLIEMAPESLDEKTVIVLPQPDTLFPLIREGMPFVEEGQYNISMGYPLTRTPLYGFFLNLFDLLNSMEEGLVYLQDYLKFMLHPYTKNIRFEGSAELNRIVLHEIEDFAKRNKIPPFISLEELERYVPQMVFEEIKGLSSAEGLTEEDIRQQLILIHNSTIRRLLSIENIEAFMRTLEEIILFIYRESTARLHPLFYPYMEAFIKELRKVSNSEIKDLLFQERSSYFHFFIKSISSTSVPLSEGTPLKGLQILGFLETRNIRFRRVIFLDLNEGVFPDLKEDYLLPYQVRKALSLPVYQDRERLLYYYFTVLTGGASEVHLFYVKDDEKERSRFLERLLWEMEKRGRKAGSQRNCQLLRGDSIVEETVNYRVELSTKIPSEIKKTEEVMEVLEKIAFNASSLDDYLRCGLRFYYSYVIGVKKKEALSAEPERFDVGILVHEVLNEYFRKRLKMRLEEDVSPEEIERIVRKAFDNRYGNISGRLYLLRHQITQRLKEFVEYATSNFSGKTILSVEEKIEENLFGSLIRGRIDLALKDNGRIYLIDYKTSSREDNFKINIDKLNISQRETWPEAIQSLQIPLYMLLYSKRYGLLPVEIRGSYLLLGRKELNSEKIEYSPFKPDSQEREMEKFFLFIEALLREIKEPFVPFMPPAELKEYCPNCDYKPLCGTEWVKGYEL